MTTLADIAVAMKRVEAVLHRRPEIAIDDDTPATSRWQGATRVIATHPDGHQIHTDMPAALAGSGDQVSPGWLFRASLGTCFSTSLVMAAAARGIALTELEVTVGSRSDTRGLLGMPDAEGQAVPARPIDITVQVRIAADDQSADTLRELVEATLHASPVPGMLLSPPLLKLLVEVA